MSIGVILILVLMVCSVLGGAGHGITIALEWKNNRKKLPAPKEPEPGLPIEFEKWDTAAFKEWDMDLIKGLSDERVDQMFEGEPGQPGLSPGERTKIRRLRNE